MYGEKWERPAPASGVKGGTEGQGRGVARYRGRRRSLLPPPPRSSCSSAHAAGVRARPRLRPALEPRGLLGTVVAPGPCCAGRFAVTWGQGWQKTARTRRRLRSCLPTLPACSQAVKVLRPPHIPLSHTIPPFTFTAKFFEKSNLTRLRFLLRALPCRFCPRRKCPCCPSLSSLSNSREKFSGLLT